ncbi:TPA: excinuclease ABC subunit UvrC [Candidatus Saccharibacteria bacterium]|nr:excinuclease ABC subunit UvrC [Candidatus Saccharibacteria bacterium]HIO87651.1 excinuclease ABC subunit UvrC [Candidatus Saccharibacteria bacterium]
MKNLQDKLQDLPRQPGVYFYKDLDKKVIYVGKAINLRNRVRQYFQKSRARDVKTDLLVQDIADLEWITVESEIEALFLEAEMIKRYMPKYNIDLRDDKSNQYVRIDFKSKHPTVSVVRRPMDDGAEYFGPYIGGGARPALKYLRRIFPFDYKVPNDKKRASLDYHLSLSPGLEVGKTTLKDYKANLRNLKMYLKGDRIKLEKSLKVQMEQAAKNKQFEKAARLRDQVRALKNLKKQVIFSDKELFDISKDQALNGLQELLSLKGAPRRIEGYDISHQSGTNNVASMVVFTNGVSDKGQYRKFKMRLPGNNDFGHMSEVISRRFSGKNIEQWPKPDLILIDGGKGQVSSALEAMKSRGFEIPIIGLAKRHEEIIVPQEDGSMKVVNLGKDSHVTKLLMRVRDESHRFAVSYHTTLKRKKNTASLLEDIPGIGPATRKKLIRTFGSIRGVMQARDFELAKTIGAKKAEVLKMYIGGQKRSDKKI